MKILIATNTFGVNIRQNIAVESLHHLHKIYPDTVDIIDVQFTNTPYVTYYNLKVLPLLSTSSRDWCGGDKELPIFSDIMSILHGYAKENGYTHWGFVNSDIIVMPNLITHLLEKNVSSMACSRVDISYIHSFQQILNKNFTGEFRWEPAGFDTWIFNTQLFEQHKEELLKGVMFLGMPEFDVLLTGKMMILDPTCELHNEYPPKIFHQSHQSTWVNKESKEKEWNMKQIKNNKFDHLVYNMMYYHLQYNLSLRLPWGKFTNIPNKEKEFTRNYFQSMNLNVENIIHPL